MNATAEPSYRWALGARAKPMISFDLVSAEQDHARWMTWGTALGLAGAAVLAITGGLPFDLPMPTYRLGIVTPTCGLTRGSTAIVRGDLALAWHYNPASFAVIAFGLLGLVRTTVGIVTGRWISVTCTRSQSVWVLLGLCIAAFWLYQQSNAEFIINARM